ncbi:hypothetical protein EDB92DRAFT_1808094 [Lactarius akahatsu]|uniref:DUF6589 domain-containing protein n=1 Tax=Lactarius akahatsu TaxID=416441 RepID=A0AAD4L5X6_9AGAM|nr:hypothetical protein EDB92DRAFT_1808094 [Lactarius akahatsu]
MDNHSVLNNILSCLSDNGYTILTLLSDVLSRQYTLEDQRVQLVREEVECDALGICAHLLSHIPTAAPVTTWALQITQSALDSSELDSEPEEEDMPPRKRARKDVLSRNTAIQVIKCVVCISIVLQSANENCNHLQSIFRIFIHSANVPQRVAEVLAHAGLTISIKSIHRAVKSMSIDSAHKIKTGLCSLKMAVAYDNFDINFKTLEPTLAHQSSFVSAMSATAVPLIGVDNIDALCCSEALWRVDPRNPSLSVLHTGIDDFDLLRFHLTDTYDHQPPGMEFSLRCKAFAWHVCEILINHGQYFGYLSNKLVTPETVLRIPVSKTEQVPMRSMKIKQSSVDGNIEVMENLLHQGGLGDPTELDFESNGDVDILDFVLWVHGNLLTKERLNTVQDSQCIEDTPKNCFQFVIFVLGLFHYKMACVDALWRTYLQVKEGCEDVNSTYQHVGILQPQETGLMMTKPGFCWMHDVVHHKLCAVILECWCKELS